MASEVNKEAFVELQGQLVDTASKLKHVQLQVRLKESDRKRAFLTLEELQCLPDDTRTYGQLNCGFSCAYPLGLVVNATGKVFILESISELMTEQGDKCQECDSSIATLLISKEYLERQMKEVESNFKELMQQTPALARQVMAISMN